MSFFHGFADEIVKLAGIFDWLRGKQPQSATMPAKKLEQQPKPKPKPSTPPLSPFKSSKSITDALTHKVPSAK